MRQKVMSSESVTELYEFELDLTEYTGKLHKRIVLSETTMEQCEAKSELSLAKALLGICRERQAEVKDIGARLNHNFRLTAKAMLLRPTYQAIVEKSQLPRKEFKAIAGELKANKLE